MQARGEPVDLWPRERAETLHRDPLESWHRPAIAAIDPERNGFHVEHEHRFAAIYDRVLRERGLGSGGARHRLEPGERPGQADPETYGRHAMPGLD